MTLPATPLSKELTNSCPSDLEWKREGIFIAVLFLVILLGNLSLLFQKTYQDFLAFNGDYFVGVSYGYNELGESLRHGWFLLWGSSMGCGEPEQAFYVAAFSYPLSVLFSLFPYPWREILFYLAHFELIGIFSYLLFRRIGISGPSSLAAAGWNALSGYAIWVSLVPSAIASQPWFYLILYLLVRPRGLVRVKRFLILVLAMTMLALAGDPEGVVYAVYFLGLWLAGCWLFSGGKIPWKPAGLILLALAISLALSSAQVLPTLNFLSRTIRSGKPGYALYLSSFLGWKELALAILGIFSRKLINLYFSLFALGFALWGVRGGKSPGLRSSRIALLAVILVLLLPTFGLGEISYHLPLYSRFVRHYKLGFILQFLVLVLAGFGLDRFLDRVRSAEKFLLRPVLIFCLIGLAGFALSGWDLFLLIPPGAAILFLLIPWLRSRPAVGITLFLLADVLIYLWRPGYPWFEFKPLRYWSEYERVAKGSPGRSRLQVFYPALRIASRQLDFPLPRQVVAENGGEGIDFWMSFPLKDYARFLALLNPELNRPAQNITQIFNYNLPFKAEDYLRPENRRLINLIGLRWLFLDHFCLSETDQRELLFDPGYFLNWSRPKAFGGYRVSELDLNNKKNVLLGANDSADFHYSARFGPGDILSFQIRSGQDPAWFLATAEVKGESRLLFARMEQGVSNSEIFSARIPDRADQLGFRLLKSAGDQAGWIDPTIRNRSKTIKYVSGDMPKLFENVQALPRGWIVHQAKSFRDQEQLIKVLSDPERFDPKETVLLTNAPRDSPELPLLAAPAGPEPVQIRHYRRELIQLGTELESEGFLVWADQYYPGWRASVNGEERMILKADLCFRAVRLGPGRNELVFWFQPMDFRIGIYASLVSILFWIAIAATIRFQRIFSSS